MAQADKATGLGLKTVVFKSRVEAEAYLSTVAASVRSVDFKGDKERFHIAYAGGFIGQCSLHRGTHSAIAYDVVESAEIHIVNPSQSGLQFSGSGKEVAGAAQRTAVILPPSSRGRVRSDGDISGISLIVAAKDVGRHAVKLIDPDLAAPIAFGRPRVLDLGDPIVEALGRNMSYVFREMMILGEKGLGSMAAAHFDELLLGLVAQVAPSPAGGVARGGLEPPALGLGVVRRAQEQIRALASEPIRLADLAVGLGVGMRALQVAFRRHVGCSPREYLLRCRLDVARERLLSAPEDMKIAAIALDCGFTDLAHFSRKYRETFGELPSATRRRRRT